MERNDANLAWEILHRYADPASAEFDAVLAQADLPDDVRRALRFWQRESVAAVKQFAAESLPAVFSAIDAAQSGAAESARKSGAAFAGEPRATVRTIRLPDVPAPDDATPSPLEERRRTVAVRLAELG